MRRLAPASILLAVACASPAPPPPGDAIAPAEPANVPAHTRVAIERPDLHGVSGMARAPDGRLFAVLERDHRLFELTRTAEALDVKSSRAVLGVAGSLDLESMAFLDDTHVVFGTETTNTDRKGDLLLFGEILEDKVLLAKEQVLLDYSPWQLVPERNRGIEGLCHSAGTLVAAVETALEADGGRYAPLGVYPLLEKTWTHHRVKLTSETGKLSGLTCRSRPDGIEVLAIERHYEVSRLVRFTVPLAGAAQVLVAEVVLDMAPIFPGAKIPNFEGIAFEGDGAISVSDNDYGGVTGPTEFLIFPPLGGRTGRAGFVAP